MDGYLDVNFFNPIVGLAVSVILALLFIVLVPHAMVRRVKFKKLRDGEQTYALRSSIRIERLVGVGCAVAAVVLAAVSVMGYQRAQDHLRANIEQRYAPAELTLRNFNGSWSNVDITLEDGTSFTNVAVEIRAGNEPFIEEVWYHFNPKPE